MESRNWLVLAAALAALAAAPSQLPEALEAQRTQAENNPRDPEVLNDLANLLVLSGEHEEAEAVYGRALELAPDRVSTRHNLALLLQQSGRNREALAEYQQVVENDPGHAWANYQIGTLYAASGRRARAVKYYARALALEPDLIRPEVNPHIVDNRFATEALLLARQSVSPAAFAPRLYQQPSRVADLLVPPMPESREPLTEEPRAAEDQVERPPSRVRTQWTPPSEADDDEADEGSRAELPRGQRGDFSPQVDPERPGAAERQSAAGRQEPRTPTGVIGVTVPPFSVPSTGTPSPPTTGAPGSGQPGLPSTGRLDLQLLPSHSELLAALPRPERSPDDVDG